MKKILLVILMAYVSSSNAVDAVKGLQENDVNCSSRSDCTLPEDNTPVTITIGTFATKPDDMKDMKDMKDMTEMKGMNSIE